MTVMETLAYQPRQPENWLYEIKQKGDSKPCYVMVPNAKVCTTLSHKKCAYQSLNVQSHIVKWKMFDRLF